MTNVTTLLDRGQLLLSHANIELRKWQDGMDAAGESRHGLCLMSCRHSLAALGLRLPPPQPKPNNVALWCGHALVAMPDKYGWERVAPPFAANHRWTLDFYSACGRLPDGRIAGHVALCDHETRTLFSSTNYVLDRWWMERRFASFVPSL